jgi:enoyl-CoA hydratase/carnithine racemase
MGIVDTSTDAGVRVIELNDPPRRNALGQAMFDALDAAIAAALDDVSIRVVLLRGRGPAFCAGFDLEAMINSPARGADFIARLSRLTRSLRHLPQPVIAAVQGAAIAGGCAILSACDFVILTPRAKVGYPVHQIGVSPAVTIPTLMQAVLPGPARALLMGGELIDGVQARRMGLASYVSAAEDSIDAEAMALAWALAAKPPGALRTTKQWLNELDGSLDDARFDAPVRASGALAGGEEARSMLRALRPVPRSPAAPRRGPDG